LLGPALGKLRLLGMLAGGFQRDLGFTQFLSGPVAAPLGSLELAGRALAGAPGLSLVATCGLDPLGPLALSPLGCTPGRSGIGLGSLRPRRRLG
jgi:hypothetical protein